MRERSFDTAESETLGMCGNSMRENREALQTPTLGKCGTVEEGQKPYCRHARLRGVGRPRSTNEAGEQSRRVYAGSGVRRGKEGDQGERTTSTLAPDTEPGMRVTGVVARTTSSKKG